MIHITRGAYNKANHIAKRLVELSGIPLECYMWFCSDDNKIIKDVQLVDGQSVSHTNCRIGLYVDGIDSYQLAKWQMKRKGLKHIGWCHSHADFQTFFSSQDKVNYTSEIKRGNGEWAYLMTVNALNDHPYCAIGRRNSEEYSLEENVELNIIDSEDDVSLDVDDEIKDKVVYLDKTIRELIEGERYSDTYKELLSQFREENPKKDYMEQKRAMLAKLKKKRERNIEQLVDDKLNKTTAMVVYNKKNYSLGNTMHALIEEYQKSDIAYSGRVEKIAMIVTKKNRWHERMRQIEETYTSAPGPREIRELNKIEKTILKKSKYAKKKHPFLIMKTFAQLRRKRKNVKSEQASAPMGPRESKKTA